MRGVGGIEASWREYSLLNPRITRPVERCCAIKRLYPFQQNINHLNVRAFFTLSFQGSFLGVNERKGHGHCRDTRLMNVRRSKKTVEVDSVDATVCVHYIRF